VAVPLTVIEEAWASTGHEAVVWVNEFESITALGAGDKIKESGAAAVLLVIAGLEFEFVGLDSELPGVPSN
jgi:hypothetical protein